MNYLTTKQAADLLGYNDESYVRKLILSGKLKAKKIGNQWVISEETIHKFRVKNNIRSKYKTLLSFNQELRVLADKMLDRIQKVAGPKDFVTAFAIGKGYKTHGAILLLCKHGCGEDASILARSLFDLLVNLLYILADKTDKRAYRYLHYDWLLRMKMFEHALEKPKLMGKIQERLDDPKPDDTNIKEVKKQAKLAQQKYQYSNNRWSDKSLFEMADEVNKIDAYKTIYRLQCQLDHNLSRSMNEYMKKGKEGVVIDVGQSENWVEESLVVAFDFFYNIMIIINTHYKLGLDKRILKLESKYVSELSDLNTKS